MKKHKHPPLRVTGGKLSLVALPREVFVSHASADRRFVARLTAILERHRIPFWYSRKSLMGAQQWHDEIGAALRRCDWFILVLSPESVKSRWVKRELLFALQEPRYDHRILPIIRRSCNFADLSWTLGNLQHIDTFQKVSKPVVSRCGDGTWHIRPSHRGFRESRGNSTNWAHPLGFELL